MKQMSVMNSESAEDNDVHMVSTRRAEKTAESRQGELNMLWLGWNQFYVRERSREAISKAKNIFR